MRTFTTCPSCGGELEILRVGQTLHEDCPLPTDDPIHAWLDRYRSQPCELTDAQLTELEGLIDAYDNRPPQYRAAALAYAAWGWPVFPCAPGQKIPLLSRTAGGRGFHDATTDTATITAWWAAHPAANVATPTGGAFDVLDIDPAGLRWWGQAHAANAPFDLHGTVCTPRGGVHAYLTPTGDGNLAGFAPGVDYRGRGGYVLLPPSTVDMRGESRRYHWMTKPSPTLTGQGVGT
ncbi:MAG TPA: bifunctional DNA primase/polymerase [Pedococcus sp.]|nr:bifunctional DNA primase/polymerase [Pedococcus sp.]